MSLSSKEDKIAIYAYTLVGVIMLFTLWSKWYQAGVQQQVYSRNGIKMTQWEIFIGAEPAERVIQIKDK